MDFLRAVSARDGHEILSSFPVDPKTEMVSIEEARGRVLGADIVSGEGIPSFTRSLVDGYAVKAKDTQGARETSPALLYVRGEVRIGEVAGITVSDAEAVYVATGSMIPQGVDAVVMQEYARPAADAVEITRAAYQGENICYADEDIRQGQVVLKKGRKITAFDVGVLAAIGVSEVSVYRAPLIAVISSGDEIVGVDEPLPPGKVRDINRYTVSAVLQAEGACVRFCGLARDSVEAITAKLESARDCDMIVISGGSSKGERDYITTSIEGLGGKVLFHGINIKPGKPAIFGSLFGKPIFGLPGHPGSCAMVTIRFVLPFLRRLCGGYVRLETVVSGRVATNIPSAYGIEEYVRVALEKNDDGYLAKPIFSKSAVISPLAQADGYVIIPESSEGLEKGESVEVCLFA